MRILQLSYGHPPTRVASGGGILGMFQNLSALVALGHEVHLVVIGSNTSIDDEVKRVCASIYQVTAHKAPLYLRPLQRVLNPETFALRFPSSTGYDVAIADLATQIRPDVIWADSTFALALAPRTAVPTVFGNYDFLFRLKAVRKQTARETRVRDLKSLRNRLRRPEAFTHTALEAFEMKLIHEAAHVMCVSASESEYLRDRNIASTFIPIVGPTIPRPTATPSPIARFFLFGNHNTAHAAALSEIRHRVWPVFQRLGARAEWHQIGRPPSRVDEDWKWMENAFDHVHGFVEDLGTVFRPGDISLVPYRHDTGFRTKFTVAAGYGIVSAGYGETFLCAPEFIKDKDAIVERDADALARALHHLSLDGAARKRLGSAAREVYERSYTFEAQLPRYAEILEAATRSSQRDVGPPRESIRPHTRARA